MYSDEYVSVCWLCTTDVCVEYVALHRHIADIARGLCCDMVRDKGVE